jgi:hypothetical protein
MWHDEKSVMTPKPEYISPRIGVRRTEGRLDSQCHSIDRWRNSSQCRGRGTFSPRRISEQYCWDSPVAATRVESVTPWRLGRISLRKTSSSTSASGCATSHAASSRFRCCIRLRHFADASPVCEGSIPDARSSRSLALPASLNEVL